MARRKQPQVSTARIYRHFAVVTLLLTGAVAVFADGENRQALAEEIAEREEHNRVARASAEKFGPPRLVKKAPAGGGSFGSDSGEFGMPMDDGGSDNASGYFPDADPYPAASHVPAAYARFGLSEAEWAALSEEEREALRREARAGAALADSPDRALQIDRLKAASAARSGGAPD